MLGGLFVRAMLVALIAYVFGEREFPAPFTDPAEGAGLGTYMWEVGVMTVGAFVLWRLCFQLVLAIGSDRDFYRAYGQDREWEALRREEERRAYANRPVMARCRACGNEFRSWDEALDHAESVHGHDRLPGEARALLERL